MGEEHDKVYGEKITVSTEGLTDMLVEENCQIFVQFGIVEQYIV
jgi:hypothetical protein